MGKIAHLPTLKYFLERRIKAYSTETGISERSAWNKLFVEVRSRCGIKLRGKRPAQRLEKASPDLLLEIEGIAMEIMPISDNVEILSRPPKSWFSKGFD